MNNSTAETQKEIENELFIVYEKNLDRFNSLIQFVFVIIGLYSVTLSYIFGSNMAYLIDEALGNPYVNQVGQAIKWCIITIGVATLIIFYGLLSRQYKFKRENGLIQLREKRELEIHNGKMFLKIMDQKFCYVVSISLIAISLAFFLSFFNLFMYERTFQFLEFFALIAFLYGTSIFYQHALSIYQKRP